MKKNGTMIFALALTLSTTMLFAGSEACKGVPTMAVKDACKKACTGSDMHQQCLKMLESAPHEGEITVYAAAAGKSALLSFDAAMAANGEVLRNKSLSGELKEAYSGCLSDYASAKASLGAAMRKLEACDFKTYLGDYNATISCLDKCGVRLAGSGAAGAAFYGFVVVDWSRTMIAFSLTHLAGNQE